MIAAARLRAVLPWAALAVALAMPLAVAATSPLLRWRDPIYVAAGLAGVAALGLLLVQPVLAAGLLPGLSARQRWRLHAWAGAGLVAAVALHVAGLWLTSPPDVVDALLLRSPTPFSLWGVIALWAAFAAALLAALPARLRPRAKLWRTGHVALAATTVIGTVLHAIQIEGTMGQVSKGALCVLVLAAAGKVVFDRLTRRAALRVQRG